jgi:hypothetical protein
MYTSAFFLMNTTQRKKAEARERETAVDEIENEITMLTKSHQDTHDRLKSLKASKTKIRKQKSSSKAESNSSGRVRTTMFSTSAKVKKVTAAAKVGSKRCMLPFPCYLSLFHLILIKTPAEIKSKKDSSSESLRCSSTTNQAAAASQATVHVETNFLMECGEVSQMDWMNDGLQDSGAYFLSSQ